MERVSDAQKINKVQCLGPIKAAQIQKAEQASPSLHMSLLSFWCRLLLQKDYNYECHFDQHCQKAIISQPANIELSLHFILFCRHLLVQL